MYIFVKQSNMKKTTTKSMPKKEEKRGIFS